MRITNSMMMGNYLSDLSGNLNRLSKYLQQQTTGKSINRISDDPVGVTKSLLARNRLTGTERYQENVKTAQSWLSETESAASSFNEIIQQAYERAVSASNGHLSEDNLKAIAEDIAQLKGELLSTTNAMIGDSYLFAGYNTTNRPGSDRPFTVDSKGHLYYNGINMNNEASAEAIAKGQSAAADAQDEAARVYGLADTAITDGISNKNGILANLREAVEATDKVTAAAKSAAAGAADIAKSSDHNPGKMSELLDKFSEDTLGLVNGDDGSVAKSAGATGLINAAQAAADEEEKAYTAWQKAVGTSEEDDAEARYIKARDAADDALTAAHAATKEAVDKTGAVKTKTDELNDLVNTAGNLAKAISGFADGSVTAAEVQTAAENLQAAVGGVGAFPDFDDAITDLNTAIGTGVLADIQTAVNDLATQADADLKGFDAMTKASWALDKEDGNNIELQVGNAHTMGISATGTELLGRGSDNIYAVLENLHKALLSGDQTSVRSGLDKLQSAQSRVLSLSAKIGAKIQRLDTLTKRYEENVVNYTQMRSDAEDVDLAEAIMKFSSAQSVYNAALAAGSKVIQTSLIDFLR